MSQRQPSKIDSVSQFGPEDLVGLLPQLETKTAEQLFGQLKPTDRAELALFCYRRAHFHDIAFAIAATCDRNILVEIGGVAGEDLCAGSGKSSEDIGRRSHGMRRAISLSTTALRTFAPDEDAMTPVVDEAAGGRALVLCF
jgi:hypothetical protein